jgi:hypothetical protein
MLLRCSLRGHEDVERSPWLSHVLYPSRYVRKSLAGISRGENDVEMRPPHLQFRLPSQRRPSLPAAWQGSTPPRLSPRSRHAPAPAITKLTAVRTWPRRPLRGAGGSKDEPRGLSLPVFGPMPVARYGILGPLRVVSVTRRGIRLSSLFLVKFYGIQADILPGLNLMRFGPTAEELDKRELGL